MDKKSSVKGEWLPPLLIVPIRRSLRLKKR